jgi:hypothetical protein
MFRHRFRPLRSKASNISAAKRAKRAGYMQRIASKYKPLTLTSRQQDAVDKFISNHHVNSHRVAVVLGLTHSAVDEYLKGK